MPPEALLDQYPGPMREIAERLRTIVRDAFPDALERARPGWHLIGYDLPVGRRTVYFAYVAPEYEHVHLGFEHGWAMHDPLGLLLGAGITKQVRWLTFRPGDRSMKRDVRRAPARGRGRRDDVPRRADRAGDGPRGPALGDRAALG